jgi:hypothetical protein
LKAPRTCRRRRSFRTIARQALLWCERRNITSYSHTFGEPRRVTTLRQSSDQGRSLPYRTRCLFLPVPQPQ